MARGRKTGGRKKGSLNKSTASVKTALALAYAGAGGDRALTRFAKKFPAVFYPLWAKSILPTEITHKVGGDPENRTPIPHEHSGDIADTVARFAGAAEAVLARRSAGLPSHNGHGEPLDSANGQGRADA